MANHHCFYVNLRQFIKLRHPTSLVISAGNFPILDGSPPKTHPASGAESCRRIGDAAARCDGATRDGAAGAAALGAACGGAGPRLHVTLSKHIRIQVNVI